GLAAGSGESCTGRDVADARPNPIDGLLSAGFVSTLAVSTLAAGFATGSGTAAALAVVFSDFAGAVFGVAAATLVVADATTSASSSSSAAPKSLAKGFVNFGAAATRVPRSFDATVVNGPLDITLASWASGIRGQCRTLPVSI